jgi:hypothetical protein
VIDRLVSRGYGSYIEILNEFSAEEITSLYEAAVAGSLSEQKEGAVATRAAQHAEGKDWKAYLTTIDDAVRKLVRHQRGPEPRRRMDVDAFFRQAASLPKPGTRVNSGKKGVKVVQHDKKP